MAVFPFEQAIKNIFRLSAKDFPAKLEQSQIDHVLSSVLVETILTVADLNFISLSWSQLLLLSNLELFWLKFKLSVCGSCSIERWTFIFMTVGFVCQFFFQASGIFQSDSLWGKKNTINKKRMWHLGIDILVKRMGFHYWKINFCITWKFNYYPYRKVWIFACFSVIRFLFGFWICTKSRAVLLPSYVSLVDGCNCHRWGDMAQTKVTSCFCACWAADWAGTATLGQAYWQSFSLMVLPLPYCGWRAGASGKKWHFAGGCCATDALPMAV